MEQNYPCDHQNLLGKLMEEGTLNPGLLDRLLGAYTIFEYGGRQVLPEAGKRPLSGDHVPGGAYCQVF